MNQEIKVELNEDELIEDVVSGSTLVTAIKVGGFSLLSLLLLVGAYMLFMPNETLEYDALESLAYEAQVIEEDQDLDRLGLPSGNLTEIENFLKSDPDLLFTPFTLNKINTSTWKPIGAALLNYEIAKISLVQFQNMQTSNNIYQFAFRGTLDQLPKTEVGEVNGLKYQAYATKAMNILAWQYNEKTTGFLISNLGASEMASIVQQSM